MIAISNPPNEDLRNEYEAKSVPPETDGFVADVDAALVQQVFDISKGKRKTDVHHNGQADDLWLVLKYRKGECFAIR